MNRPLPRTLDQVFPVPADAAIAERAFSRGDRKALGVRVKGVPGLKWPNLETELARSYRDLMNVGLVDLVVGGWSKANEILQAGRYSRQKPDKVICLSLLRHHIVSTHRHRLEVCVGGVKAAETTIDINVELQIGTAVLRIQEGYIRGLSAIELRVVGTVDGPVAPIVQVRSARYVSKEWAFAIPYQIPPA